MKLFILILCLTSFKSIAQIANASFFPSMRSINPGVSHLRTSGFMAIDASKTSIVKHQDILTGGILDGVTTEVDLDKKTLFYAGKGPGITGEFILDQETGERTESFETSSYKRSTTTNGDSSVIGGTIDFGFIGLTLAKANYSHFLDFHVDETPNLNRETHDTTLEYTLTRIGTAFSLKGYSIGAFYSIQKGEGSVDSILYNPTTGAKNSPEVSDLDYETVSYGIGVGYVSKKYHFELSYEDISKQSLDQSNTYLLDLETPGKGNRISAIGEVIFGKLGLGFRVRQINGNYSDIEQLISSNMLFVNQEDTNSRLETSFNFSWGSGKGFSLSGFYTSSSSETKEESDLLDNGFDYDTTLTSTAYGATISYVY